MQLIQFNIIFVPFICGFCMCGHQPLTPKGPRPFFCPFLKFGKAIVDAIFVQIFGKHVV
jgi:hypothetical protein